MVTKCLIQMSFIHGIEIFDLLTHNFKKKIWSFVWIRQFPQKSPNGYLHCLYTFFLFFRCASLSAGTQRTFSESKLIIRILTTEAKTSVLPWSTVPVLLETSKFFFYSMNMKNKCMFVNVAKILETNKYICS